MTQSIRDLETTRVAAKATNEFGLKMLSLIAAQRLHKNVFVSPLSIFAALVMAENGATGETRDAIRHSLAVPVDTSEEQLHQSTSNLLKLLREEPGVKFSFANALWADVRIHLSPNYVEQCRELYEARASTLDFSKPAAADAINRWVSDNTQGKIPTLVNASMLRTLQALLTNAVYFQGAWTHKFPKTETRNESFYLAGGSAKQVPMMHQSGLKGAYRAGDGYEAAVLSYEYSWTGMYAILPAQDTSPEEALSRLSLEELFAYRRDVELELKLPRFTLDFEAGLADSLKQMGMGRAFEGHGEFTPLGSQEFFLGDVLHKTRLEVDEEGTVAAAATGLPVAGGIMPRVQTQKKVLVFDRPFALLLCDVQTGAILFAGVVYEPQ